MLRTRSSSMILRLILHMNVLSSVASAFWRLPCYARLGVFRIDPIVSEGRPSQHAHTLHGGQSTCCVSVEDRCLTFSLLSLHVWRKTLCGGMPVTFPTTTNSTTAEKHAESRIRDLDRSAFSALYIFGIN